MDATYRLARAVGQGGAAIECLLCGTTSHSPDDVNKRYCGRCHLFHDLVTEMRRAVRAGAGHECAEWRTAMHQCALCGGADLTGLADADLFPLAASELEGYEQPLEFVLRPSVALELAGLLQLALRHPDVATAATQSTRTAVTFIEHVRSYFVNAPAVREMLRRG